MSEDAMERQARGRAAGKGDLMVRLAKPADAERMAALDAACFPMPWSEKSFQEELTTNERAVYIVAEADGKLAGYAGLWIIGDEGHITNVAVRADMRRKHVATGLLQVLMNMAGDNGVRSYTLEARTGNQAAIALYQGLGFAAVGVRPHYYIDNNEDALIMWLTL